MWIANPNCKTFRRYSVNRCFTAIGYDLVHLLADFNGCFKRICLNRVVLAIAKNAGRVARSAGNLIGVPVVLGAGFNGHDCFLDLFMVIIKRTPTTMSR